MPLRRHQVVGVGVLGGLGDDVELERDVGSRFELGIVNKAHLVGRHAARHHQFGNFLASC